MLLQNLHVYLSETELLKVVQYLDSVTRTQQQKTSEYSTTNSPQTQDSRSHRRLTRNLSSDNLISPLPLSEFPQICTFSPKQFPPHLRPHRTPGSVSVCVWFSGQPNFLLFTISRPLLSPHLFTDCCSSIFTLLHFSSSPSLHPSFPPYLPPFSSLLSLPPSLPPAHL